MVDADRRSTGGLYLGPVLRPLSSDSEFFDEGNTNRALLCKLNVFAIMSEGADTMDLHEDQHQFECMFQDCTATFSSLKRHEEHYETSHRHRCFTCGRSFPTHRLLDLHLSEAHDSFFRAMAERRPMYACLVEGCPEVFESSGKRHEHLVEAHLYPESFDFSRPSYTRKKARANRAKDREIKGGNLDVEPVVDGRKGKLRARGAKAGASNEAEMVTATQRGGTSHPHSAPGPTDKNSRRSGQGPAAPRPPLATAAAAAAAASPRMACRFWRTAGGCRRGNDCKFVHAAGAGGDALKGVKVKEAIVVGGAAASSLVGSGGGSGSGRSGGNGGGGGRGGGGGGGWGGRSSLSRAGARDDVGVVLDSGGVENGVGVASAEGMMVMGEDDDGVSSSGGVEELINGMSKLLIPRQMGFGSSSRRGDPIV